AIYLPSDHPPPHSFPTRRSSDLIAFFAFVAIFASVLAPYDPNGLNGGVKNQLLEPIWTKPFGGQYTNPAFLLGTDELSRDILSRSEEHTSELQSRFDLVCRLLLE